VEAESCGDDYMTARAHLALGSALVHAMVEHVEAAAVLHRAAEIATRIGTQAIAATAHRELAFVDLQAGRGERAAAWLDQAASEAGNSDEELASISGLRGVSLSDAARYEEALEWLEDSVERADRCGNRRQAAFSTAFTGRVHLLTGRLELARGVLERSLELVEEEKWIAFEPLPEALLAHVDLEAGRIDEAMATLEHAFAIGCQVGDPCWEGISCRGLGLVEARRGRRPQAIAWLADARARCTRVANPYQWMHGWILDALCAVAVGDERLAGWIDELGALAARTGMRELVVRSYLHRGRGGDPSALAAAGLLSGDIGNPILHGNEA
jgi:tetratricopeptide (TPR) repeat protein